MNKIDEIQLLGGYLIWMRFRDGVEKIVDFRPFLGRGFTAELLLKDKFAEVFIEGGGGLAWPDGYDFCPNYLHDYVAAVQLEQAS